jgi:hypothetical protein
MPALVLLLSACKMGDGDLTFFEPSAVGLRFDGLLRADGSLATASYLGQPVPPTLALEFVSDDFFLAATTDELAANSCLALAPFELAASSVPLPTYDDSALFVSYEVELLVTEHSCAGRVDPERWGEDAFELWGPFMGARLGYGLGPMTEDLQEDWSSTTLQEIGTSMAASWVALNDLEGNWVASDWSTSFLFAADEITGAIEVTVDEVSGEELLVPLDISALAPPDPLPAAYIQTIPNWYQDFSLIDFDNLAR